MDLSLPLLLVPAISQMSLPTFTEAMQGFTTDGLTPTEALKKRAGNWNWNIGAKLLGKYLDGNDLAACCLVSRDLHKNFMSVLWSKPLLILETKKKYFCKFRKPVHHLSLLTQNSENIYVYA